MTELWTFVQLGFRHIVTLDAADHILFLAALAAIYRFRDARRLLWVITAFTVGHSLTLMLAVTGTLVIPPRIVEFLIPLTIVATGVENLVVSRRASDARWDGRYRPVIAGLFGLVHGAGFAGYLQSMFVDRIAMPLFGFNVGIELGQLLVLAGIGVAFVALDALVSRWRVADPSRAPALRIVTVSLVVVVAGATWAFERAPW